MSAENGKFIHVYPTWLVSIEGQCVMQRFPTSRWDTLVHNCIPAIWEVSFNKIRSVVVFYFIRVVYISPSNTICMYVEPHWTTTINKSVITIFGNRMHWYRSLPKSLFNKILNNQVKEIFETVRALDLDIMASINDSNY